MWKSAPATKSCSTAARLISVEGSAFLDRVASILKTRTRKPVSIEGHTDNVGPADLNRDLSELRALAVMKGLMDRGVPKTRMAYVGYGMSRLDCRQQHARRPHAQPSH